MSHTHHEHEGHHHHDHHNHVENNPHGGMSLQKRLSLSIWLNAVIVIAQILGGIYSGSLALLSDSMHNLSDVAALGIALFAIRLSQRPATVKYTYGMKRAEVLAALLNGATLLIVVTLIVREAIERILHPQPIASGIVLIVASIGLLANAAAMFLLRTHAHDDLNMKGAFLHLLQDTISSLVVIGSALLVSLPYGQYFDPIASLVVAIMVLFSGWHIVRDALHILMEGTPHDIDLEQIQSEIEREFPIQSIHHIHIWEIGSGGRLLTAHVKMDDQSLTQAECTLNTMQEHLNHHWKIDHCTLMPEVCGCQKQELLHS